MTREEMEELKELVHWDKRRRTQLRHRERAASACEGKDKFSTHSQAEATISWRLKKLCHAYRCSVCNQWHIGGMRAARERRVDYKTTKRNHGE